MRRVLVIFGGVSPEHDVSLMSATSVFNNIDTTKNEVIKLGITKQGAWYYTEADNDNIKNGSWVNDPSNIPATLLCDKGTPTLLLLKDSGTEKITFDIAFPMLHGENGEDGRLQGLFELASIPFTGPGMHSSANGMDKSYTKIVLDKAGIPQAKYLVYTKKGFSMDCAVTAIEEKFSYPVFVKPASTGSSCGVSKASDREALIKAIDHAFEYDKKLLVEEFIKGKEIEVAVLGEEETFASVCGMIAPAAEFYDFDAKYNDDNSKLFIPAPIDEKVANKVREAARKVFEALECKGHSRVDFFVMDDGSFVLNEINTLPGFTNISMYPKLMMHTKNITYAQLIDLMIDTALRDAK